MVVRDLCLLMLADGVVAEQPARHGLDQLDPLQRVAAIMAILGLVLTGLMLIAAVMIGARWVRRLARQKRHSTPAGTDSASRFANKRLRESLDESLPDIDTAATVQVDRSSRETKVDRKDAKLDR